MLRVRAITRGDLAHGFVRVLREWRDMNRAVQVIRAALRKWHVSCVKMRADQSMRIVHVMASSRGVQPA